MFLEYIRSTEFRRPPMRVRLTNVYVEKAQPQARRFSVRDAILPGLLLRVEPSGKKTWLLDYSRPDGRRNTKKIGDARILTVAQARESARQFLAAVTMGADPAEKKKTVGTFQELIDVHYADWVVQHRKNGRYILWLLRKSFPFLMEKTPEEITLFEIEKWRTERKMNGLKNATINKKTSALRALLNWAYHFDIIEVNPLLKLKRLKESDSDVKTRYLAEDERTRLLKALDDREEEIRRAKESHNKFLRERGLPPVPTMRNAAFVDHLKPAVIISLNTGIRRGALLSLEWKDVNLREKTITLQGGKAKGGRASILPINNIVSDILSKWRKQSAGQYVFEEDGKPMRECKTAWRNLLKRAEIEDFRWHDMRHDFASRLVMAGVDLNTVRELLCHSDIKMTLRYAHLAPEVKRRAVDLL